MLTAPFSSKIQNELLPTLPFPWTTPCLLCPIHPSILQLPWEGGTGKERHVNLGLIQQQEPTQTPPRLPSVLTQSELKGPVDPSGGRVRRCGLLHRARHSSGAGTHLTLQEPLLESLQAAFSPAQNKADSQPLLSKRQTHKRPPRLMLDIPFTSCLQN